MMKKLILCDIESWAPVARPAATPRLEEGAPRIVAMAVGTRHIQRAARDGAPLGAERLAELASIAADCVASTPRATFHLEVALVLTSAEAADGALLRLLREAGTAAGAGDIGQVDLLSNDAGLARLVAAELGAAWAEERHRSAHVPAFRAPPASRTTWLCTRPPVLTRTFGPPEHRSSSERDDTGPTIVVDRPAAVDLVQARALDLPTEGGLTALAKAAERQPELATQLGPTTTSMRGVSRLMIWMGGARPALEGVSAADEVEVAGPGSAPGGDAAALRLTASSAGAGAARLEWGAPARSMTVRTKLPLWLLDSIGGLFGPSLLSEVHGRHLDSGPLLQLTPDDAPAPEVTASLLRGPSGVRCVVEPAHGSCTPETWWVVEGQSPTTKLRVDGIESVLPVPLTGIAAVGAVRGGEVVVRSLLAPGRLQLVRASDVIAPNTIGMATAAFGPDGERVACAVLALGRPIAAGSGVAALAVQSVSAEAWARTERLASGSNPPALPWTALRRLPLLVHVPGEAWHGLFRPRAMSLSDRAAERRHAVEEGVS